MITILVPVLGRPANAQPLVDSIRANTRADHEITFIASWGDKEQIEACEATGASVAFVYGKPGPGDYGIKMQAGFDSVSVFDEWVFLGSDDITFEKNWDTHALRAAGNNHVVATNDMANSQVKRGQFGTHCLVRTRYVTEQGADAEGTPGTLIHPGYDHNFCDRELCHVAQSRGVYAFARHSVVRHRHPLWRTARHDATYEKGLKGFKQDQRLFLSRAHLWNFVGLSEPERRMAR